MTLDEAMKLDEVRSVIKTLDLRQKCDALPGVASAPDQFDAPLPTSHFHPPDPTTH